MLLTIVTHLLAAVAGGVVSVLVARANRQGVENAISDVKTVIASVKADVAALAAKVK